MKPECLERPLVADWSISHKYFFLKEPIFSHLVCFQILNEGGSSPKYKITNPTMIFALFSPIYVCLTRFWFVSVIGK